MKLYVASSWRNEIMQQATVGLLRDAGGHEVYDFIHPPGGDHLGFSWAEVDPEWRAWSSTRYLQALDHPIAVAGFESDFGAMQWADAGVLVLPCGRSAHLEAGYFVGAGKPLWIMLEESEFPAPGGSNPELMYRMATGIVRDIAELLDAIREHQGSGRLMGRYAEGTKVSVESSRGDITGILAKHGVERMGWMSSPTGDELVFELGGASFRFTMTRPTAESLRARDGAGYAYPQNIDWEAKAVAEWRRIWRANVLLLKAKLEFIESGDTTLDRELMAYRVLKDGRTLEDAIAAGGLPMLAAGS